MNRAGPTSSGPPRVVLVASNLHVGGGVQVAASLVDEWSRLAHSGDPRFAAVDLTCEVSPEVRHNLSVEVPDDFRVVTRSRRPQTLRYLRHDWRTKYDRALVVFGPHYFPLRATWRAAGYADVTSVYPTVVPRLTACARLRHRLRRTLSVRIAQRFDLLVVETPAMAERCAEVMRRCPPTLVVPNTLSEAARGGDGVPPPRLAGVRSDDEVLLLYTARPYLHKNLDVLPEVRDAAARLGTRVRFVVTLTPEEWATRSPAFRESCVNVGSVRVDEIPGLHAAVQGVFFPSLLEASSATPIEALAFGTPLFASDRDFVRSVAGDAAHYVDPLDPEQAARVLVSLLAQPGQLAAAVERGHAKVQALPTAADRADAMLRLLCEQAAGVVAGGARWS